jgi:glycolate oxidase
MVGKSYGIGEIVALVRKWNSDETISFMMDMHRKLAKIVGEDFVKSGDDLEPYSHDKTFVTKIPEGAVLPANTIETAEVVEVLYEAGVPIVSRGSGTGLSGGSVATQGGVVVSLERLTACKIDAQAMTASVGAGVITAYLRDSAAKHGLAYPPDPASIAISTIGGNIATNAGGPSCLKYGVTADYVLGLTAVLAGGRVVRFGGGTRKRSSGYRLAQLMVGSEGTLGIVAEATLALVPAAAHSASVIADFGSLDSAATGVEAVLRSGITPVACEFIDATSLGFVSDLLPSGISTEAAAILLIEVDGNSRESVASDAEVISAALREAGASTVKAQEDPAEREGLWEARRAIGLRLTEKRAYRLSEDLAVPLDRIQEMVQRIHEIGNQTGVSVALFGHAGDGNLHPSLIFDDRDPRTLAKVEQASSEMFKAAIELGGTVSAEHGLGAIKREFLTEEAGLDAVEVMWGIKELFDPKGLFNPGKVLPTGEGSSGFLDRLPGWQE